MNKDNIINILLILLIALGIILISPRWLLLVVSISIIIGIVYLIIAFFIGKLLDKWSNLW